MPVTVENSIILEALNQLDILKPNSNSHHQQQTMGSLSNGRVNGTNGGHNVHDAAPVLKGTVKHQPDPNIHNIMITGGAGFM